jgi:hypothetical protein
MPLLKSNNNVNKKRRSKGGAELKKLGMPESKVMAIYYAGQYAMITTTTGTGVNDEKTIATGKGHTNTTRDVVVITNDDASLTMVMILTDNGNAEGGIPVTTTTSGVITIEKEGEEVPWSHTINLVVGSRVLQSGNALAALRAAKNRNVGTTTPKIHIGTIDPITGVPRVTILKDVRVEGSQGATAPQAWNYDANRRLAPVRTGKIRPLLEIAYFHRISLQRRLLVAILLKASLILPLAHHFLPILQRTHLDLHLHLSIHPKWINTSRPIMTPGWTSHQSWPLMGSYPQVALRGGMRCYKSFVCGGRKRRRRSVWRNTARLQSRLVESSITFLLLNTRSVDLPESGTKGRRNELRSCKQSRRICWACLRSRALKIL